MGSQRTKAKAEKKKPKSASDNNVQEDEDDEFDENADWSDEEEGKVYDIFEKYNLVWTEVWDTEEGKGYEKGDSITIYGSADQNQRDKPSRCTALFTWGSLFAQFTCIYRPETQIFTDFKAKRKTLDGGMQSVCGLTVGAWEESWSKERGEWVREEVKDDRGHLFLIVMMDFGQRAGGKEEGCAYGKKVVEQGGEDNVTLTEGEKERLCLPWSKRHGLDDLAQGRLGENIP